MEFIFYLFNGVLFLQGSAELLPIAYSVGILFNWYFYYGALISHFWLSILERGLPNGLADIHIIRDLTVPCFQHNIISQVTASLVTDTHRMTTVPLPLMLGVIRYWKVARSINKSECVEKLSILHCVQSRREGGTPGD